MLPIMGSGIIWFVHLPKGEPRMADMAIATPAAVAEYVGRFELRESTFPHTQGNSDECHRTLFRISLRR